MDISVVIIILHLLLPLNYAEGKFGILSMEKNEHTDSDYTFSFASYYQNNMVLQKEPNRVIIWGYGTVGAYVNISVNVQDVYSTRVKTGFDERGIWSVRIKPQPAGATTDIQGVHDYFGQLQWILLKNILFGDVWVCSGQSNMQFTMSMVFNATEELKETTNYPNIRIFTVAEETSMSPLYDLISIQQSWSIPSPESVGGGNWTYFSAVCWLYGRYLYDKLQIPIGLVATTWGGTPVEAWSSPAVLDSCGLGPSDVRDRQTFTSDVSDPKPNQDSVLWNAMIHPLLKMTIKGAIWYQGEANSVYNVNKYQCMFPNMIQDWRKQWSVTSESTTDTEFPFGFVQLATDKPDAGNFPLVRWHQTADVGYIPNTKMTNTFMAVAMDLPDNDSPYSGIHPRDKQDVAQRLAAGALSLVYGQSVAFQGPFPEKLSTNSNKEIVIEYPEDQKLAVVDNGNFQVCCRDDLIGCDVTDREESSSWTTTSIVHHSDHTIYLDGHHCTSTDAIVTSVRYAWALEPCVFKNCSVYNTLGLPAPPFILKLP